MTDLEKAARMALEALGYYEVAGLATTRVAKSITALRQELSNSVEQPAQQSAERGEPVAYLVYDFGAESQYLAFDEELGDMDGCKVTPLYEHPPASKPWVGLTDAERKRAIQFNNAHEALAVVIEAKLKEKNIK